jgi:Ca-activated chloride channel family protein
LLPRPATDARTDRLAGVRGSAEPRDREQYAVIDENPFLAVSANPRSTFSIDVDRASYRNVRRFIREGRLPPRDAVRIEELVNYFPPNVATGEDGENPFTVASEVAPAPWNRDHRLVRVVLQGRQIETAALPPSNLVFLIDVSGSMQSADKLPLLKQAFQLLVAELRPQDRVAIVVYAGNAGLVLPSTPGDRKDRILDAINDLEAGGSTAGGAGIRLAYEVARQHYMAKGNNRVILATDGDFNVGTSSDAELVQLIEEKRKQGTFLTVLGFGTGNLQDAKMEQLADRGNGNYAYVDDIMEARKVLVHEIGATLVTIAKDVKVQVEFNPARVAAYRLIGYENRLLRDEDFADDTKDAGEMGAGQTVTALYEIVPVGAPDADRVRRPDSLRYSTPAPRAAAANTRELMYVKLRYKDPSGSASRLFDHAIVDAGHAPSDDFTFTAAVASFGMLLRQSEHRGRASFEDVIAMADRAKGADPFGYRAEFVKLARAAQQLAPEATAQR